MWKKTSSVRKSVRGRLVQLAVCYRNSQSEKFKIFLRGEIFRSAQIFRREELHHN